MNYRKPTIEDQEYKWGDERHREEPIEPVEEDLEGNDEVED